MTTMALRQAGYTVVKAKDRNDAYHLLTQSSFNLVIVNQRDGGLESISLIRNTYPSTKILLYSGGNIETETAREADEVLYKTGDLKALYKTVAELLDIDPH